MQSSSMQYWICSRILGVYCCSSSLSYIAFRLLIGLCFLQQPFVCDAGTPFKADRDLWLSPEARLLADSPGVEDFVYDGQGKRLVLPQDISVDEPLPLILIGPGKTLQLKNLKLVYAASLPACLQLGPGMHTCNKAHNVSVLLSTNSMKPARLHFPFCDASLLRPTPSSSRLSPEGAGL